MPDRRVEPAVTAATARHSATVSIVDTLVLGCVAEVADRPTIVTTISQGGRAIAAFSAICVDEAIALPQTNIVVGPPPSFTFARESITRAIIETAVVSAECLSVLDTASVLAIGAIFIGAALGTNVVVHVARRTLAVTGLGDGPMSEGDADRWDLAPHAGLAALSTRAARTRYTAGARRTAHGRHPASAIISSAAFSIVRVRYAPHEERHDAPKNCHPIHRQSPDLVNGTRRFRRTKLTPFMDPSRRNIETRGAITRPYPFNSSVPKINRSLTDKFAFPAS